MIYVSLWSSILVALTLFGINPSIEQLHEHQVLEGYTICIDAGHGGQIGEKDYCSSCYTGGAIGASTGQTEGDVNLRVSYELKNYLEYMGAKTVMTREDRCRITGRGSKLDELLSRVHIAEKSKADLLLSVHHNYSSKPEINYSLVLYGKQQKDKSKRLASHIANHVSQTMRVSSNGVMQGDFAVLNHAPMPAVIIEASFMSNHKEDCLLANPMYNRLEAWGIAKGVAQYAILEKTWFKLIPQTKDWSEKPKVVAKPKTKAKSSSKSKKRSKKN